MDGLKTAAFVGTPFLVMLGATTAFVKMQNPEDIFLSDGTYIGSASDFNMKSEYLNVDGDDLNNIKITDSELANKNIQKQAVEYMKRAK